MSVETFRKLHHQNQPLLIANTWDAISTEIAEKAGFKAIGTSSHAIANILGYEDGENMPFEEHFFIIDKICKVTKLPISCDIEAGYSDDPMQVAMYVAQLSQLGVVGINIEDGITAGKKRTLGESQLLARKIKTIKTHLINLGRDIFINARIDTYTTKYPKALDETIARAKLYEENGANGFFVPLINESSDIEKFMNSTSLPLNTFLKKGLKTYDEFAKLGVHRVSSGNAIHALTSEKSQELFDKLSRTYELP